LIVFPPTNLWLPVHRRCHNWHPEQLSDGFSVACHGIDHHAAPPYPFTHCRRFFFFSGLAGGELGFSDPVLPGPLLGVAKLLAASLLFYQGAASDPSSVNVDMGSGRLGKGGGVIPPYLE